MVNWSALSVEPATLPMYSEGWTPDLLRDNRSQMESGRVARARGLLVEKTGRGSFAVFSDSGRNDVLLYPHFACSCGDFSWKDRLCKHLIAALIEVRDPDALSAVADLAQEMVENDKRLAEARERPVSKMSGVSTDDAAPTVVPAPSVASEETYLARREERRFRPRSSSGRVS